MSSSRAKGLIWLRVGPKSVLLWMPLWTYRCHFVSIHTWNWLHVLSVRFDTAEFGRSLTFVTALNCKMSGHKDGGSNSRLELICTVNSFVIFWSSPNIIWVIKWRWMIWVRHTTYGWEENCVQGFGGETGRKGGHRHRWENNIRICLERIGLDGMDWVYLAENRSRDKWWNAFVNKVMDCQVL